MTTDLHERWLATAPPVGPETDAERVRWKTRFDDPDQRARAFFAVGGERVRALVFLFARGRQYQLLAPRVEAPPDDDVAALMDLAVDRARIEGAGCVQLRLPVAQATSAMIRAIARTGGRVDGGRIEYRRALDELPVESSSVLAWHPVDDLDRAAALYERTSSGTRDGLEPGQIAREGVEAWLASPHPAGLRAAVDLGAVDGRDVALVCAHVDPADGWSGLSYMGLVPEVRGRALGHLVHRHGLARLRGLGGRYYHGGTSLENGPMRACFARQDVTEFRRFDLFRWDLQLPTTYSSDKEAALDTFR